jgi:hypothetical protein
MDSPTLVRGYRLWVLGPYPYTDRLRSVMVGFEWHPGDLTAKHLEIYDTVCPTTFDSCYCGFYALKRRIDLIPTCVSYVGSYRFNHAVAGTILLWGTVVEGERGYRATHTRVESFIALTPDHVPLLRDVADKFEVPIHTAFDLGEHIRRIYDLLSTSLPSILSCWLYTLLNCANSLHTIASLDCRGCHSSSPSQRCLNLTESFWLGLGMKEDLV